MNTFVKVMHVNTCNCAACASVPTLGIKMPYEEEEKKATKTRKTRQKLIVGENDLATVAPEVAAMLSEKDKHFAFEVTAGSNRKLTFVCPVVQIVRIRQVKFLIPATKHYFLIALNVVING